MSKGIDVSDLATAELTAYAHEARMREMPDSVEHLVTVDLVASEIPATGEKGVPRG
jgi:hypothetical protein